MKKLYELYRFNWSLRGFLNAWARETSDAVSCIFILLAVIAGCVFHILKVVLFPIWRLLLEPIVVGFSVDEKTIANIKRINDA